MKKYRITSRLVLVGILLVAAIIGIVVMCNLIASSNASDRTADSEYTIAQNSNAGEENASEIENTVVEIYDTSGLRIYYPKYKNIDLVCGRMPAKDDKSVIMFAEAAFTGELIDTFKHSNVAGDHVSNGQRFKGFKCKRNNGAFVYYNGRPKFIYKDYSQMLDKAAAAGGCGFAQEMMIHGGEVVPHTRKDSNTNEFRALCLIDGRLAIADSKGTVKFGDFIKNLLSVGATEALYMDMGAGWNYSWYRDEQGAPVEIHHVYTKYATNWLTFYN